MKSRIYFNILYGISLFLISFDQIREGLRLNNFIFSLYGIGQEIIAFIIVMSIIFINRKKKYLRVNYVIVSLLLLFGYILLSVVIGLFSGVDINLVFRYGYRYLTIFIWIFIFFNMENISSFTYEKAIRILLRYNLIIYFLSLYVYFVRPSFIYKNKIFNSRVSVGNPSIVSFQFFSLLIIMLFFDLDIFKSKWKRNFYLIVMFLATVSTFTGTAMFTLVVLIIVGLFIRLLYRSSDFIFLKNIFIIIFIFVFIIVVISQNFDNSLEQFYDYFLFKSERIVQLIKVKLKLTNEPLLSRSYEIRDGQIKVALESIDKIYLLTGLGSGGYFLYVDGIENQYNAFLINYGIIGLFLYLCFLFSHFYYGLRRYNKYKILIVIIGILMSIYSLTLEIFICYSIVTYYALIISYLYQKSVIYKKN